MNEPKHPFEAEVDGVPTLMPDAQVPGTVGPGVRIGNFELQTLLGRGGMGEVWKAWDRRGERPVVIKLVPPELHRTDEEMARVRDTFRRVHALQHQHICPLYLLDEDLRLGWYLVMKYIDGQTLSSYRASYAARHGAFPVEQVVKVLRPVAEALDYAHRHKVIHRDIKPQNIMVVGNAEDVQVVDFGLAAEIRTTVSRFSQQQMDTSGTRPYMAPEQWKGRGQDARTDQYALAVVAYELLGGALPFDCADFDILRACVLNDPPEALEDQSPAVNCALLLGLAKRREERFETCGDFVRGLSGCTVAESRGAKPGDSRRERSASAIPVDLGSGECAQCKTANERHRKFCRECAAPLRVQCLKCAVEIPVWDKVCPECGAIQAKLLAKRQRELEALRAKGERLLSEYAFDQAAQTASKLAAEQDRRLQRFKDWGDTFLVTIAKEKRRHEENVPILFAEAKDRRQAFDYAAAMDALNRIPKPLRTTEMSRFLDRVIAEQDEANQLGEEIRERVNQHELDGLLRYVTRALELRGNQPDLQDLKAQLEEREERLAFAERRRQLESLRVESERLLSKYAFDQAAQMASRAAAEQDQRLQSFKDWADTFLQTIAEEKRRQEDNVLSLFAEAKQHRKVFDYLAAIDALNRIPKPLLTLEMSSFLDRLIAEQTEADELIAQIRERIKQRDLDGLLSQVTRALELRGDRVDLQRLQEQLQEREERLARQRDQKYAEAQRLSEQGRVREALALTRTVEIRELRSTDVALKKRLETIVEKENALGELVAWCKSDGVIDGDDLVMLLTATWDYRTLNSNNPKVNELHDQCQKRFETLPADAFSRVSPKLLAKLPGHLLVHLPIDVFTRLPPFSKSIGMPLRLIPPGEFWMGSDESPEELLRFFPHSEVDWYRCEHPGHRVKIRRLFEISRYPVTVREFRAFVEDAGYKTEAETSGGGYQWTSNEWKLNPNLDWRRPGFKQGEDHPVVLISWNDVIAYCQWLSQKEGREYRLPTESEWEYACRAGTTTRFCFGDDFEQLGEYGWYFKNSGGSTHPVGQKKPNDWDLYDMHGNVWEWCADWWDENSYQQFAGKVAVDPIGPSGSSLRVVRGGCWVNDASGCRSAARLGRDPGIRLDDLGFRVARAVS